MSEVLDDSTILWLAIHRPGIKILANFGQMSFFISLVHDNCDNCHLPPQPPKWWCIKRGCKPNWPNHKSDVTPLHIEWLAVTSSSG